MQLAPKQDINSFTREEWKEEGETGVIFTTYFSSKEDPQRFKKIDNTSLLLLEQWQQSVSKRRLKAVIFHDGIPPLIIQNFTNSFVKFHQVTLGERSTNDERFFVYYRYLTAWKNKDSNSNNNSTEGPSEEEVRQMKRVLMTDLFDVRFNKNPFDYMKMIEKRSHQSNLVFVGSENGHMDWWNFRLYKCNASFINETLAPRTPWIVNAGIVGGNIPVVLKFLEHMIAVFQRLPSTENCNNLAFNYVVRYLMKRHYVTGPPFHSPFKEYSNSTDYYITHK